MSSELLAEFETPEACARAIVCLRERGVTPADVHMPYAAKAITRALEVPPSPLPRFVFLAGGVGACVAYLILWYTMAVDYPHNVGGRPSHAPLAFVPVTFETLVLFAGCAAFFGCLWLSGLPRLHHPFDAVEGFGRVSTDRFWLRIDLEGAGPEGLEVRGCLEGLGALRIAHPSVAAAELGRSGEVSESAQ